MTRFLLMAAVAMAMMVTGASTTQAQIGEEYTSIGNWQKVCANNGDEDILFVSVDAAWFQDHSGPNFEKGIQCRAVLYQHRYVANLVPVGGGQPPLIVHSWEWTELDATVWDDHTGPLTLTGAVMTDDQPQNGTTVAAADFRCVIERRWTLDITGLITLDPPVLGADLDSEDKHLECECEDPPGGGGGEGGGPGGG